VEGAVLTAAREQHRIIRQRLDRWFRPSASGKRLIDALVIEFRPEESFERFEPSQLVQQIQNVLLSVGP
jgi:hypothetical protein